MIIIFYFFSIKLYFKSIEKIITIIIHSNIGAYGLVQQNNVKNKNNFIKKLFNFGNLNFKLSITKNKQGMMIKIS